MKDYSTDQKSKKKYILDYFLADDKTITVIFADGTRFFGIENTDENLAIIEATLEKQARRGLSHLDTFKRKYNWTCAGMVAASAAAIGASFYASSALDASTGASIAITGAAFLSAYIPTYIRARRAFEKVTELEKIKYRDEHRDELDSYMEHPNSLSGVPNRQYFDYCARNDIDPFSVLSIDSFTQDDLEAIVENVERENNYGFSYQKVKNNK